MFLLMLCISGVILDIESARILGVFPTPSISHQVVFRPLVKELANRGHEVVVITTDPAYPNGTGPPNLIEIDVHDISYNIWSKLTKSGILNVGDPRLQAKLIFERLAIVFEEQMTSPQIQDLINDKNQKFDLLFTESCVKLALSFSYLYKVPLIEISSLGGLYGTFDDIVSPIHPLLYPIANQQKTYKLSVWEKIYELYVYYGLSYEYRKLEQMENKLLKKIFGSKIPDLEELKKNTHMLFLNIHSVWDFNRPVPPNVLYLGGLHLQKKPPKDLSNDLKSFLDSSTHGVIYMSFGTNVMPSTFPPEKIKKITQVLSELPYDILWKWDSDKLPNLSKNVRTSKWFPQSDLLRHPKVQLFITQGGLQSTDEALTAGVPLVVIPMLGDQWYNAEQYVYHGIGIKLLMEDLNENTFKTAIHSVIGNASYRQNVIKLRSIMRDQTQIPLEKAVWWTEYVLRNKGAVHLRARGAHIPWTEYYEINLILVVLDLKSFLDSSTHGVIYMSFGTNVMPSTFPPEKIKKITQVLSELPYDILWKWDSDKLPNLSKNVRTSKWFPQSDLLRHPKVQLFITQGGLQSTDEALTAGVPLVVIPMLGDQWYNAEQYVYHGIGIKLLMEDLNENTFKTAIHSVIGNASYRQNVIKLRSIMRDQTQIPLEKAVWWTEYVLRNKGAVHLRARGAHIPWTEYYEVNLILVVLVQILILIAIGSVFIKFVISQLYYSRVKRKLN